MPGGDPNPTATVAGGTHPTGMDDRSKFQAPPMPGCRYVEENACLPC